jgi:hypothetical protein
MVDFRDGMWVPRPELDDWVVVANDDGGYVVSGRCPRCDHPTVAGVSDMVVTVRDTGPGPDKTREVHCACTTTHRKAPAGTLGCGARWLVGLVHDPADGWQVVQGNDDARLAAIALDAAVADESKNLSTVAEKWLPGIVALYGLFGLAGLATSADEVGALAYGAKVAVAVLGVLGLLATGGAIVCSYLAAYGWPKAADVSDDEKLMAWYEGRRQRLQDRAELLTAAVGLSIAAAALLTLALGTVWFGPTAKTPSPEVTVTYDGGTVCGEVVKPDKGEKGVIVVSHETDGGTSEKRVTLSEVVSIVPSTCG